MALSANYSGSVVLIDNRGRGESTDAMLVSDTDDAFFLNAMLVKNLFTQKIRPLGATGEGQFGAYFVGLSAQEKNDGAGGGYGASSGKYHPVNVTGALRTSCTVAGATSALKVGLPVYSSSDDMDDMTLTRTAGAVKVGHLEQYRSSGVGDVRFLTPEEALEEALDDDGNYHFLLAQITLTSGLGADVDSLFTLPGSGTIRTAYFKVTTPTTDNDAAVTLTPNIAGTVTTGGAVSLTDTAGTAPASNVQFADAIIPGTLTTAANAWTSGQAIGWDPDSVTAYSDGAGELWVVCSR